MPFMISLIVALVLILILVGIGYGVYRKIKRTARDFARMAWGTNTIAEGIRKQELEYATTPKSVAGMTSIKLPMITKDFPDFHYNEMKTRAENVLVSYLRALDEGNVNILSEGTEELKKSIELRVDEMESQGLNEQFDNIKIHRTEIRDYVKNPAKCSVIFQSSVEYYHYKKREDGSIVSGDAKMKTQARYNVECIYIQDRTMIENLHDAALATNCPNCGGPLEGVGAKVCKYCGSPIIELNILSWHFDSVKEA